MPPRALSDDHFSPLLELIAHHKRRRVTAAAVVGRMQAWGYEVRSMAGVHRLLAEYHDRKRRGGSAPPSTGGLDDLL